MKRIIMGSVLGILAAALLFAQNSPEFFQPMRGITRPSVCRIGEMFVDLAEGGALDGVYVCTTNDAWELVGISTLAGLTDVTITSAANGDFLFYNGTAWVDQTTAQVQTQLSLNGTLNAIAKFNATDVADSSITDDGVTVDFTVADIMFTNGGIVTGDVSLVLAGTDSLALTVTGAELDFFDVVANDTILDYVITVPITAAAQTTNLFGITPTNANHTGGTVNAFNIGAITGDADATEIGARIVGGFDYAIAIGDGAGGFTSPPIVGDYALSLIARDNFNTLTNAATTLTVDSFASSSVRMTHTGGQTIVAGQHGLLIDFGIPALSSGQTSSFVNLAPDNSPNHTGGTFNGLNIASITEDPQATESAINIQSGYDVSITTEGAITSTTVRADFNMPSTDGTSYNGADADEFFYLSPELNLFGRIDGAQSGPLFRYGALTIDNDGIDDEGVEYVIIDRSDESIGRMAVVGTSPAMYVKASFTITSVSGTDNFYFGWRLQEAFVDNLVIATYDTYGVHRINDTAGNLQIQTGDDTVDGTDENDQVAVWADGETHVLMVVLNTNGSFEFFIDDLPVTQTNAVGAASAGEVLYPVIGLLNAADADTALTINYIEYGEWFE